MKDIKKLYDGMSHPFETIHINIDTSDKIAMFIMGMAFAAGKQIKISNKAQVATEIVKEETFFADGNHGPAKSFNMMARHWEKNKFTPNLLVENKAGHSFVVCPVRKATESDIKKLGPTVCKLRNDGEIVHYPDENTNQNPFVDGENTGGYNICFENASAIAKANTVRAFYLKNSVGSVFDLGVTYYLQRQYPDRDFELLNPEDVKLKEDDFGDQVVKSLLELQEEKTAANET